MGSVLTMDQGGLLQHHMPLHNEYSLPSDHDCIDQFSSHAHPTYAGTSAVDHLRRDGSLSHPGPTFAFTATNHPHAARFNPNRGVAPEANSYHTQGHFTDSGSGSISTSPSSAASSFAYTNYGTNHCTSLPTFPGPVPLPQPFVTGSDAATRVPSILDGSTSSMPPPPHRSYYPTAVHPNDNHREAYATYTPSLTRSQLSSNTLPGFGSYPETPRSVVSGPASTFSPVVAGYPTQHMTSSGGYGSTPAESLNFPWPTLEVVLEMTCEGQPVTPEVHAKVEKGFFLSTVDQKWTCYRRNYFSVACHFELHPHINNGRMFLKRNNNQEQIQAMGMRLSAAVDGPSGKGIELIQHTPKRDNGPKSKIEVTKVSPTPTSGREQTVSAHGIYQVPMQTFHPTGAAPMPYLPLQGDANGASPAVQPTQHSSQYPYAASGQSHLPVPGQHTTHTFERVQFKQATANNGKRRASQQYFCLIVELFGDVRKEGSDSAVWVKIAQRVSEKIVVRGRSPSHYQNEGGNGQTGRGGSSSGGSGYSTASGPRYGSISNGGFRSSVNGYGGSASSASGYRSCGMHDISDNSGSSPDSVDEGAVDTDHPIGAVMSDAERAGIHEVNGYQYYPGPIYEPVPQQMLPPLPKVEGSGRYSSDPRQYAVKAEYIDAVPGAQWQVGGCSRFQGVESSRGYFPDLSSGYS